MQVFTVSWSEKQNTCLGRRPRSQLSFFLMAPELPGRHCVHLKQYGRLLLCSVYVPSSHSLQLPKRSAVQAEVKRVPEAQPKQTETSVNCSRNTEERNFLRPGETHRPGSSGSRCCRSHTPGRFCSGGLAASR